MSRVIRSLQATKFAIAAIIIGVSGAVCGVPAPAQAESADEPAGFLGAAAGFQSLT